MSASNLFVNGLASFLGTIFGVFIIPYLKYFLRKSNKYALRIEQYLSELEREKDSLIHNEIMTDEFGEVSLNDTILYKDINDKVEKIIQILHKNRYDIKFSVHGKYGERLAYFLEKIFDRYISHEKEVCESFNNSYFSLVPHAEIITYRDFVIDEGHFASAALKELNIIKSSIWHRKIVKKVMDYFC